MTQAELRAYFLKYSYKPAIEDTKAVLAMFADFLVMTVHNHHGEAVDNDADGQARLILQMMLTKTLHLRSIANGVTFTAKDGTVLNNIIDSTVVASAVRNMFETTGMFNLIYRSQQTAEEKEIVYLLWVIAGLSYRQRFESNIISAAVKEKQEFEKKEIARMTEILEKTKTFQGLDEKNKEKIRNRIKSKEYLVRFEQNKVIFLAWHDLINVMGLKPGLFDNIYTYFSLYSHPSNVSVFQFGEMFEDNQKPFLEITNFNLSYAIHLLSIFIADYIHVYPSVRTTFEELPLEQQLILNYPNKFIRGDTYSINDSWKALG